MQLHIRAAEARDWDAVLQINAMGAPGVSRLDAVALRALHALSCCWLVATHEAEVVGYLVALLPTAPYDGEEFRWFRDTYRDGFLYVDQIAVAPAWRKQGCGAALYRHVIAHAQARGLPRVVLEVNVIPPNPSSLLFHRKLGFREVGTLLITDGRSVALMALEV